MVNQPFVLLALVISTVAIDHVRSVKKKTPWMCHGYDCPQFTAAGTEMIRDRMIEFRIYDPAMWITTEIKNTEFRPIHY